MPKIKRHVRDNWARLKGPLTSVWATPRAISRAIAYCRAFARVDNASVNELTDRRVDNTLDEVFLKINGKTQYLRRAVDQDGNVLDILV
jgi:hypothetical protein